MKRGLSQGRILLVKVWALNIVHPCGARILGILRISHEDLQITDPLLMSEKSFDETHHKYPKNQSDIFKAAIAALNVTMSVGPSVRIQRVLDAI